MDVVKAFNNELSSLYEGKPPISKAKMTQLTRTAIKGIKFYKHVVQSVEKFIQKCRPEYKVPGLYVIDSIVRQSRHQFGLDRDLFVPRFSKNIVTTFQCLYKCPAEEKPKIVKVLNLWQKNNVFPTEIIQPLLDMAHMEANAMAAIEIKAKEEGDDGPWMKPWSAPSQTTDTSIAQQSTNSKEEATQEAPIIDSSIISQLQEITSQLLTQPKEDLSRPKEEKPAVKFNKKLLDFDYGDEEEEVDEEDKEENGHATTREPNALALSMAQNLLSNPELLHQLQQMQQTIQLTEALKTENKDEIPNQNLGQSSSSIQDIQMPPQPVPEVSFAPQQISTHSNYSNATFSTSQSQMLHSDSLINIPLTLNPQLNSIQQAAAIPYGVSPPLFPSAMHHQNFSPVRNMMLPPNMPLEGDYPLSLHGLAGGVTLGGSHMEVDPPSVAVEPGLPLQDQDERQVWLKDSDEREKPKKERSRSRSRSPRSRSSKSSRRHKRSRSKSPKRRRSSSKSPSRHRRDRDRRSDSKDYDKEVREVDSKEKERRKLGLPVHRKGHLAVCSTTLWLGHVPKMAAEAEIQEIFAEYGTVTSIDLIPPRGCAYVCMEKRADAAKALYRLKNMKIQCCSIKMAWAPGKGVKGKEYKTYWDVEQGVAFIPHEKMPDKSKWDELAEGGMIDEESFPDNMKDGAAKSSEAGKDMQLESPMKLKQELESSIMSIPLAQVPLPQTSMPPPSIQLQQEAVKQVMQAVAGADQATLMAGIHLPMMPGMPMSTMGMPMTTMAMTMSMASMPMASMANQFGMPLSNMVPSQQMLLPQIPLPMGVPPPSPLMMMANHSRLLNPPPMAVLNHLQPPPMSVANPLIAHPPLSTQPSSTTTAVTTTTTKSSTTNQKDPEQMDEASDATPTEEDSKPKHTKEAPATTTSLPSNFPSNPTTNMTLGYHGIFPPNRHPVPNIPSPVGANPMGMPPGAQWAGNPNGPIFSRAPMPPFNSMHLMNPGRMFAPNSAAFGAGRPPNLPPNSMGFGHAPNPGMRPMGNPDSAGPKPGRPMQEDFEMSANSVPLGRPRGNFGSKSPPRDVRGPPPRMPGQNPMAPHPPDMNFRHHRPPMMPGFGPRPGGRFPFVRGERPFMMRGPPGMGMPPRGMVPPQPDIREDGFDPEWQDRRPPFGGMECYDEEREYPPRGGWDREEEDMGRGRRQMDRRRNPEFSPERNNFGPRKWNREDERFPPRDEDRNFRPNDGFDNRDDRRRRDNRDYMERDRNRSFERDTGRDYERGGHDGDRGGHNTDRGGHNTDRGGHNADKGGHNADRGNNDADKGSHDADRERSSRDEDDDRERSRGRDRERRGRRESRWNRSRSHSRENSSSKTSGDKSEDPKTRKEPEVVTLDEDSNSGFRKPGAPAQAVVPPPRSHAEKTGEVEIIMDFKEQKGTTDCKMEDKSDVARDLKNFSTEIKVDSVVDIALPPETTSDINIKAEEIINTMSAVLKEETRTEEQTEENPSEVANS